MKKIIKIVLVMSLFVLGGCSMLEKKRNSDYVDKHFKPLAKIYPTKNVEDIFDKIGEDTEFIHYTLKEENGDTVKYIYQFNKRVANTLEGILEKKILKTEFESVYTEKIEYREGKIHYVENKEKPSTPITFLFEHIDYEKVKDYEFKLKHGAWVNNHHSISYYLPNEILNKYNLDVSKKYFVLFILSTDDFSVSLSDETSIFKISEYFIKVKK